MRKIEYPALDETVFRRELVNGLDVIVVPRKGFSRKIAYFTTNFGAVDTCFTYRDEKYRVPDGIAHFLEHKIFDMPDGRDVTAEFAACGAAVNAFTSYDMTAYYFSCTENFDRCLHLLLEFVSKPYFTDESVEKELGIIDQEIGMNEDSPDSRVYENLVSSAYGVHPIRVPILGTRESIRKITPELLELCHNAFYVPENMVLCVVGDVDPEQICATALEVLGDRDCHSSIPTTYAPFMWDEPEHCPVPLVEDRMEVAMPTFSMLFKCPQNPCGDAGFVREIQADLAAEVLFGESSELYLRLYEEGLIDSSFGGGFEVIKGCAMLMISGDSEDPEAVRDAIIAQAQKILREGISREDFDRMIRSALGSRIKALDSFDSTCFRLTAYELSEFDYFDFPRIYRQVKPEDILEFLEKNIRPDNCALSVLYPTEQEVSE